MKGRGLVVLLAGTLAAGCGGSSSGPLDQLQAQATRICLQSDQRLRRISGSPTHSELFLRRGVAVLGRELRALRRLRVSGDASSVYQSALAGFSGELSAIDHTIAALDHQQDAVIAFRALEHRLVPLERQANGAWKTLGISACAS